MSYVLIKESNADTDENSFKYENVIERDKHKEDINSKIDENDS